MEDRVTSHEFCDTLYVHIDVTLLVNAWCLISNAMGTSLTRGMCPVSPAFKCRMQDRVSARFRINQQSHINVYIFGKPYLPTFYIAFKARRNSAEVPRSSKESCCPIMAVRFV